MPRNPKSKKRGWHKTIHSEFYRTDTRKPENYPLGSPENPCRKKGDRAREAERMFKLHKAAAAPRVIVPTNEQAAEQADREAMEEYDEVVGENQE
jgi:hypothetical protein